jgi:plastocyanin
VVDGRQLNPAPSGTKRQFGSLTFTTIAQWRGQQLAVFAGEGFAPSHDRHYITMKLLGRLAPWRGQLLAAAFVFSASPHAFAAMTNVNIQTNAFDPPVVDISVNDQVKWTWKSNLHSTTSDDALWDSGVQNAGYVFTNTFTSAGSFPYTCVIHYFTGTVMVEAGPNITNVNITTNSFDPPTVIINVNDSVKWTWVSDFHTTTSDTALWDSGQHNTGFVFTNRFTSAGSFPYICVVHGFGGTVGVQGPAGPPPLLSAQQFVPPSTFGFEYSASVGLSYVVSRSGDLSTWVPLSTNIANSTTVSFQDTNAPGDSGFYRVFQLLIP